MRPSSENQSIDYEMAKLRAEIERLRAALHAIGHGYEEVERVGTCAYARWALAGK